MFKTDRMGRKVVKITDFGISRDSLSQDIGATTFGVGTVTYMAPEQFFQKTFGLNQSISERTDIWAFGIILYRMLTGTLPFSSQEQIAETEVNLATIPVAYRNIIKGCLQKHASKRYASAKDVMAELDKIKPSKTLKSEPSFPVKTVAIIASVLLFVFAAFWVFRNWKSWQPVSARSTSSTLEDSTSTTMQTDTAITMGNTTFDSTKPNEPEKAVYVTNKSFQLADTDKNTGNIVILPYTYTGWIMNNLPNGQGTKTFQNGNKYIGPSKNGKADGNGTEYIKRG